MKCLFILLFVLAASIWANDRVININESAYSRVSEVTNLNILVAYQREDNTSVPMPIVRISTEKEGSCGVKKIEPLRSNGYAYPFSIYMNISDSDCLVWVKNPYTYETIGVVIYEAENN